MELSNKTILLTGGTGTFGKEFTKIVLKKYHPKAIRIFSRDELKQYYMRSEFNDNRLKFLIGDVRDRDRLYRAMHGVDIVVHAAALKQVPSCEYNPFEAIRTNIIGSQNVIESAIDNNVEKVLALSTDKAVNPINLYGATKLCAEKLFIQSNSYAGGGPTRLSCVRYGNVLGSRGSVVEVLYQQRKTGVVTITDPNMTRFWITPEQAVMFVIKCIDIMQGGEVFIPKLPTMRVIDLVEAIAPGAEKQFIGIRPGEKVTEVLLTEDESRYTYEFDTFFMVLPQYRFWDLDRQVKPNGSPVQNGFCYSSQSNSWILSISELKDILSEMY